MLGKRITRKCVHYPKKKTTKAPDASSTPAPSTTALERRQPSASSKSSAVPPVYIPTDQASTSGIQEVPSTKEESAPSEDEQPDSQPSAPTVQVASLTPATPVVPSVATGTPHQFSTPDTWTQIEVDRVIFHSRDKCDHEADGEELRRAVASRLVKDGQVLHPSLLNPRQAPTTPGSW